MRRRAVGADSVTLSIFQRQEQPNGLVVEQLGLRMRLFVPFCLGGCGSSSTRWIATARTGKKRENPPVHIHGRV